MRREHRRDGLVLEHLVEFRGERLVHEAPRQVDTLIYGLPDLSPYAVDASVNPVLVVSDVLGYVFNWFYNKPLVREGGSVIILNPVEEVFHPEYHVAYQRFYDEALAETTDPFELQSRFQRSFAEDPDLIDAYRNRWAHHGFHPFTVWYWATYPLRYLSQVILVGPKDDRSAKRLGVKWARNLDEALEMARSDEAPETPGFAAPGVPIVLCSTIPIRIDRISGESASIPGTRRSPKAAAAIRAVRARPGQIDLFDPASAVVSVIEGFRMIAEILARPTQGHAPNRRATRAGYSRGFPYRSSCPLMTRL